MVGSIDVSISGCRLQPRPPPPQQRMEMNHIPSLAGAATAAAAVAGGASSSSGSSCSSSATETAAAETGQRDISPTSHSQAQNARTPTHRVVKQPAHSGLGGPATAAQCLDSLGQRQRRRRRRRKKQPTNHVIKLRSKIRCSQQIKQ